MAYKIIPYTPRYLTRLIQLLDDAFVLRATQKETLIRWKFFSPSFKEQNVTYLALDEGDQVVAQYTNIPTKIRQGEACLPASICIDMATRHDHRRRGLISLLAERVYEQIRLQGKALSIGFSNDAGVNVDRHASAYGYRIVGCFARYYGWCRRRTPSGLLLRRADSFSDVPISGMTGAFLQIEKDAAYLTWRYLEKPGTTYELYRFEKGSVSGYVVLVFLSYRCYVHDIITDATGKEWGAIVTAIENLAAERGARVAIFHVLDNAFWRTLLGRRYLRRPTSKQNTYFTVKTHDMGAIRRDVYEKDAWLVMNGDIL